MDRDALKVTATIDANVVGDGFWNGDENSQYAIGMDSEANPGTIVWHRSNDWRLFGRMYGWKRVAKIVGNN